MNKLNVDFWREKYVNNNIKWDLGEVSLPLKDYFDQLKNKDLEILIPGAGNAYEAEYLHNNAFKNVHVVEWVASALEAFKNRVSTFPKKNLFQVDFFNFEGQYDLIIEQCFFCAIDIHMREEYIRKVKTLLKPGGKYVGLLFNIPLNKDKPPFGATFEDYQSLFSPYFSIDTLETAHNSITPRKGNELFIIAQKL